MAHAVRVNATMGEDLLRRVDAFAAERYEDRSTALRQLVAFRPSRTAQARLHGCLCGRPLKLLTYRNRRRHS